MGALELVDDWDVGSVAAGVIRPGRGSNPLVEVRGDVDAPFALASVSKILSATAVLVAVEEGTIALDDEAGPEDGSGRRPTVRHLLAHASGLPPDGDGPAMAAVGTRRIYSNRGFEVLADTVTAAAGMPWTDYIRSALVDSLALGGTDVSGPAAHGHRSTVTDLARLLTAVVDGDLLAPATVEAMTTPFLPELAGILPGFGRQDPNPWGLGVEIRGNKHPHWTAPGNAPTTWGHFGRAGTFAWFDPVAGLGLIVLTDREFGPWAAQAWPVLSAAVLETHT